MRASLYTAVLCPTAFASFLTHAPRPTPGEQDPVPISLRGEQEQAPRVLPGGDTPLHEAVEWGSENEVKKLIQEGADVNAVDKYGDTPLYSAMLLNLPEIMKILIEAGADVNKPSGGGTPPLHYAAASDRSEIVEILIEAGADVDKPDSLGEKPFVAYLKKRQDDESTLSREMAELVVAWKAFELNEDQRKLPVEGNQTLGELEQQVKTATANVIKVIKRSTALSSQPTVLDLLSEFVPARLPPMNAGGKGPDRG